jgi:TolB-like protein
VIRVGIAYVLLGWVVLQGADFLLDLIGAPEWVIRAMAVLGLVGLPFALFFAWAFEMTPEGIKRDAEVDRSRSIASQTGQRLNAVIIGLLAAAVVQAPAEPTGSSVAVLPFVAMSRGEDDEYFADGMTEEILNSLAQLPELLVTARTSAFQFKDQDVPVQDIASRLGVQHIVAGSVRRAGERVRVTAQLIRAADGVHLWSNAYDRTPEDVLTVQEEIAESIAAALDVVLDDAKRARKR